MPEPLQQLPITTSLPPLLQQLSSHEFGKLIIELNIEQLQQLDISKFQFSFLGAKSPLYSCTNPSKKTFQFPILTTLWHFYQYLKDMNTIYLHLQTSSPNKQLLTCHKPLQLLPATKVITPTYTKGNYIANSVELCDIYCGQTRENKGYVMFKVKVEFDEEIHGRVKGEVEFGEILSNPEENGEVNKKGDYVQSIAKKSSPFIQFNPSTQQPKPHKQSQLLINSKQLPTHPHHPYPNTKQNISLASNLQPFPQVQYSQVKHLQEDESKMIQDDIDRLIQEMQGRPYDSSRYLDVGNCGSNSSGNNQFVSQENGRQNYNMMNTQTVPQQQGSYYQSSFTSINSIPVDSRMNRFQQDTLIMTQQSNRSYHNSRSPINNTNRKYPPIPLPPNNNSYNQYPPTDQSSFPQQQQFIPNQTIYSHTKQRSVSPMNSRNRSLTRTQQSPFAHNQSMKNLSYHPNNNNSMVMTGSMISNINNSNKGTLKIHIHQLLGKDLQLSDCLLRVYVNNELQQVITCKGYQQGEVIAYNQKAQLNDAQLCDIERLRFELENYQGEILYSTNFEITRLINIPKLQGIFMLNLIPHNQPFYGNQLTASQTVIKKLQKPPSLKNLRITLSFTQQLQVIQIYMNLSKFSLNFTKCKYKIPLTKQTVEFDPTDTHFNIFPHSKAYPKLMIEFWDQKAIIGVCQVSLVQLKTITKNILQCNLQPIYLYDTMMPIKNIFTQNQVGKFKLLVCCGNVRQVQHVLNKTMLNRTMSMMEMGQSSLSSNNKVPVQVQYDKKLGVFIKERKQKSEIEIQVDEGEIEKQVGLVKNNKKNGQQQQDDHEVSMMSQNEFLSSDNVDRKGEISLSKVHSIKLSQQEEIEDEDDEEEDHNVKQSKKEKSPQFMKKKSSSTPIEPQPRKSTKKPLSSIEQLSKTQTPLPLPPPIPLITLQSIILSKLKQTLSPLTQPNFTPYQQLKKSCKPHLLFNFLDIDLFIKHLIQLGISKHSITQILQLLQPLNGMVNFNLLNDFMMCLQLEGEVKYNLVPNKLFVKMALEEYYQRACEEIDKEEQVGDQRYERDEKKWLSSRYLNQIDTLDESIDFNQIKKLFLQINIKISMNQYTLLKNFLQNQKDIRAFLFQLAQSKQSYQQMIKSQKNLYEVLKLCVIQSLINKKKQQQLNQKYQQSILDKLYSSKIFENQLNESMMSSSSIHRAEEYKSELAQSKASECYEMKPEFVETKKNYLALRIGNNEHEVSINNDSFMPSRVNTKRHYDQQQELQDDDDFIINGLNAKSQPKVSPTTNQLPKKPSQKTYKPPQPSQQSQDSDQQASQIINSHKYKQPTPQISLTKNGQTIINYSIKRTITLTGLQDCKTTCECQLDMQLKRPFLKLHIQTPFEKKLYFKQSDQSNTQTFEVRNGKENEDEEIQGTVTLSDVTKRGEIDIAMARFVVIKGIQSVYALKTLKEDTFCGLVKIIIE